MRCLRCLRFAAVDRRHAQKSFEDCRLDPGHIAERAAARPEPAAVHHLAREDEAKPRAVVFELRHERFHERLHRAARRSSQY